MNIKRNQQILLVFLFIIAFLLVYKKSNPNKSIENVYYEATKSIVELKASSEKVGESYGTAVVIGSKGYMVTNMHVLSFKRNSKRELFDKIYIRFADEELYKKVKIINFDEQMDIAILKLEDSKINVKGISIGNSKKIEYGETVYAVGNALNFGISISQGIISAPQLEVKYDGIVRTVVQADINISAGNSGGALIDQSGHLIGITSFRIKEEQDNEIKDPSVGMKSKLYFACVVGRRIELLLLDEPLTTFDDKSQKKQ